MNTSTRMKNKYKRGFIGIRTIMLTGSINTLFFAAMLIFSGCSNTSAKIPTIQQSGQSDSVPLFALPEIPAALADIDSRTDYLVSHYWDNFNFSDTMLIHLPEVTEQAFVDYIDRLPHVDKPVADNSIRTLLSKCETDSTMRRYFTGQIEKYLHEPNSPLRNEEFYITAMEYVVISDQFPELEKLYPKSQLELAYKNRVGTTAANFSYITSTGSISKMHNISAKYLLIYFYNPDCSNCQQVRLALQSSPTVNKLIEGRFLKILAVYPNEDLALWTTHVREIPKEWINSYNTDIKKDRQYELQAIPSLYLLDKNKTVLLKDADFVQTESYLLNISSN